MLFAIFFTPRTRLQLILSQTTLYKEMNSFINYTMINWIGKLIDDEQASMIFNSTFGFMFASLEFIFFLNLGHCSNLCLSLPKRIHTDQNFKFFILRTFTSMKSKITLFFISIMLFQCVLVFFCYFVVRSTSIPNYMIRAMICIQLQCSFS